jgi:hypothetical protein
LLEHDPEKWIPVFGKDHAQLRPTLSPDPPRVNLPPIVGPR